MGFHGQSCQAVPRAFKQGSHMAAVGGNGRPERLFLCGVEQQAAVLRTLFPSGAKKALPVLNVGRGPGGEPLGTACAMEGDGEGTRGPIAGRNHKAAALQPGINFYCSSGAHSWFIRWTAARMPMRGRIIKNVYT